MTDKLIIFDTTLRDGEQSPGASMTKEEKLRIARQLEKLGVDVIEAGFAAASPGDFEAVSTIAKEVRGPVIAGLCRDEAEQVWRTWNPVIWAVIKHRGFFSHATAGVSEHLPAISPPSGYLHKLLMTLRKYAWEWIVAAKRPSGH